MRKLLSVLLAAALALTLFSGSLTAAVNEPEPSQDPAVSAETEESQEVTAEPVDPAPAEGDEADSPETTVPETEAPEEPDAADGGVSEPEISGDPSEEEDEELSAGEASDTYISGGESVDGNIQWNYDKDTHTLTIEPLDKTLPSEIRDFNGDYITWRTSPPWDIEGFVISNIEIAEGIKSIGEYAFSTNRQTIAAYDFTSITFPSTLEKIGNYAFLGSSLESVVIPETLKHVGICAFSESSRLSNVILEEGLTDIGACAFSETAIESIVIPESVISVEESAFSSCRNLSQAQLPSSITDIQYGLFRGCTSLSAIEIPASVKSIDDKAFSGSSNQVINFNGVAPIMQEYVVTGKYSATLGSFDTTDTLVYSAENAASWTSSEYFDPLYNTYYGYNTEVQGVCNHSGSKYVFDQNGHTLVCEVCGRGFDFAEHSYDANGKCVCGYVNHEHEWEWQIDEYSHYKVCSICGFVIEDGLHDIDTKNCTCRICNQTVHQDYRTDCDENEHWKVCSYCKEKFDIAPHTYNENKYSNSSILYGKDVGHYRECDNCYYADESTLYPHVPSGEAFIKDNYQPHTVHFYKCGLCGGEFSEEHVFGLKTDYSDFVAADLLGMSEEEALEVLKKTFGEENVEKTDYGLPATMPFSFYSVHLMVPTLCSKCGYDPSSRLRGVNVSITMKNNIVSSVSSSSGAKVNAPRLTRELPDEFTVGELKQYAAAGTATFNGVEFTVTYSEEKPVNNYGFENATYYVYEFSSDDYVASCEISNFRLLSDSETQEIYAEEIEILDSDVVSVYEVSERQKYTPADVDGNGSVTLDDALLTLKCAMNIGLGDETFNKQAADVTGDGNITVDDAIAVLKIAMNVKQ